MNNTFDEEKYTGPTQSRANKRVEDNLKLMTDVNEKEVYLFAMLLTLNNLYTVYHEEY
jgi:hypothetical protein